MTTPGSGGSRRQQQKGRAKRTASRPRRAPRSSPAPTSLSLDVHGLFSIQGKVALVTGGSRGIGLMIARGYVEAGAKVYVSSRKAEVCDAVAAELSAVGQCVSLPADLSTPAACTELAQQLAAREPALHVLVNNAGANWGAPIDHFPTAGFEKVMDLNVNAMFFLTRDLVGLLEQGARPGDPARVINIGSIDGIKVSQFETYAYAASKAGVHHLTKALAVHLGRRGIAVNAIAPGPFESKMTEWMLDNFRQQIEANCPLGRIGQPSDMAGIAIFLAAPASAYLSGAVIPIDGGISVK